MQSILNYLITTQQSILTKNIHTVYVAYEYYDTPKSKKDTIIGQSISDENHKTIFFKALTPKGVNSQHFENADAVARLRDIKKTNKKVIDRFLWWLTDGNFKSPESKEKRKEEHTICSILSTNSVTFQHESYKREEISSTTFNLHLNSSLFFDAINTDKLDAIQPSSDGKEIQNLENYSKGIYNQKK